MRQRLVRRRENSTAIAGKLDVYKILRFVRSEAFRRICGAEDVLRELAFITSLPAAEVMAAQGRALPDGPAADAGVLVLFTGNRMVVWWLVLVYAMFGAAWLLSRRRKVRYWIPAACSVLALCAVLTVNAVQLQRTSTVTALDVSQGQSIVFSSGRACAVVDCGGRSTAEDPGDLAARKLLAQGHRSLDLLVLTHPHDDHVNGVLRLMHWLPVRTLVIPAVADTTQAPLSDLKLIIL